MRADDIKFTAPMTHMLSSCSIQAAGSVGLAPNQPTKPGGEAEPAIHTPIHAPDTLHRRGSSWTAPGVMKLAQVTLHSTGLVSRDLVPG